MTVDELREILDGADGDAVVRLGHYDKANDEIVYRDPDDVIDAMYYPELGKAVSRNARAIDKPHKQFASMPCLLIQAEP